MITIVGLGIKKGDLTLNAIEALESGAKVLLVDRKPALGGVLLQCAHRGFHCI